jgi:CarboxypepD_reg-like domain
MNNLKSFSTIFFITFLLLHDSTCLGQTIITGKVIDSSNKDFLIGTSVQVEKSNFKTISNEEGDFELNISQLPVTLIFSHVGYKKEKIVIVKAIENIISLTQEPVELAEVQVGNPAIAILNAIVQKTYSSTSAKKYYKTFYRRISANDGDINRVQEMFANVTWNIKEGISEWQPINIRYAEVNPLPSRNLYFLSFLHAAAVHKDSHFPINNIEIGSNYSFKVKKYFNIGTDNEVAVINFESLDTKRYGEIYVNTKKDILLKIKESQKIEMQGKIKKILFFEANFKEYNDQIIFDNIFITETTGKKLDLRKANEKVWLYFQNEISVLEKGNIYPAFMRSDTKIMTSIPYDTDFWKENIPFTAPISIKKIIEKMEKSNKFTSNFF